MKTPKKITKAIAAIASTLFLTTTAVLAVNISVGPDGYITEAIWNELESVINTLTYSEGDGQVIVAGNISVNQICAVSGTAPAGTDISLNSGDVISSAKWTALKDLMAKFDVDDNYSGTGPFTSGETVVTMASANSGIVNVYGSVCAGPVDNQVCLDPPASAGSNCFPPNP